MRNFTLLLAGCLVAGSLQAQYKKASFHDGEKSATLEATGRFSFLTKSKCIQPAVAFSFGRENSASRYFSWHDIEFLLPSNYQYSSTVYDYNSSKDIPVTVKAQTMLGFTYRFNSGIFLIENSENNFLPFVNFGANFSVMAGNYDPISVTASNGSSVGYYGSPEKSPYEINMGLGLNGGVGFIYKFTKVLGVKVTGGWAQQLNITDGSEDFSADEYVYSPFKSHPYATVGIRFTLNRRN